MKFSVADRSISVKVITSVVIIIFISLLVYSFRSTYIQLLTVFFLLLIIAAYLFSPSYYQIVNNDLIVLKNLGRKNFQNIKSCRMLSEKVPFTVRLFGNGGVFAGTGIFWNKKFGIFRAYVTTGNQDQMVFLDTDSGKVVISPSNPDAFIKHWNKSRT